MEIIITAILVIASGYIIFKNIKNVLWHSIIVIREKLIVTKMLSTVISVSC